MPQSIQVTLTGGHNSKRDPAEVGIAHLIKSIGGEYKVGDPDRIHRIAGRTLYGGVASVPKVKGIALATYDDDTTFLLAVGGTDLYYSDASNGLTGTFTVGSGFAATRSVNTNKISAAHFNNRWFVASGEDRNLVIEKDATIVTHGMFPPKTQRIVATTIAAGSRDILPADPDGGVVTFTSQGGSWYAVDDGEGVGSVFDANGDYSGIVLGEVDDFGILEIEFTATDSLTGKFIDVQYYIGDRSFSYNADRPDDVSDFGDQDSQFFAVLWIYLSTDNGATFPSTAVFEVSGGGNGEPPIGIRNVQIPVDDAVAVDQIHLRFTFVNTKDEDVNFRIYSAVLRDGGSQDTYENTDGAMYYAISEYDSVRGWESILSDYAVVAQGESYAGVEITLPTSVASDNATDYNIYRTSNNNPDLLTSELGLAGRVAVGTPTYTDNFVITPPSAIPSVRYEFLILDQFGEKFSYEANFAPPRMTFLGAFKGALFGLNGRSYHQSVPGRPNQWPRIFTLDRMPFKENSRLIAGFQVDDVLWIGAEAGVVLLDHPAQTKSGLLSLPGPRRLEGAPGLVGEYGAAPLSFEGESLIAWVTNHGIVISNLATYKTVTEDVDWEANLSEANLAEAVLTWDEKNERLILDYDSTGDGVNDKFALIHMGEGLRTKQGRPLITWDHPGTFTHRAVGRVGGLWKSFTCNNASEEVYVEGGTYSDASNSYDGSGNIPLDIQTGREYAEVDVDISRASVLVTQPALTVTLSCYYQTGRDIDSGPADRTFTTSVVALPSAGRSMWYDFNTAEAGEYMQWRFTQVGKTSFAIGPIRALVEGSEKQGEVV